MVEAKMLDWFDYRSLDIFPTVLPHADVVF